MAKIHIVNKFEDYMLEEDNPMLPQVKDLLQISVDTKILTVIY